MTRLAQRDQIAPIVRTTFTQRQLVVDLFGRYIDTILQALLTHRMACSIAVPDSFPCSSIPAFDGEVTVIAFVSFVLFLLVFLAEPAISQVGTAGM